MLHLLIIDDATLAINIFGRKVDMETKVCTKCKRELPIDDFNWRDKNKGTRRSECKYCHTAFMKQIYDDKKSFVANIKAHIRCQKCGEKREYTLDFHHIDPNEKESDIVRMTSNKYRIDKVLDEIAKCIVLCANCHREFHYLNDNYQISIDDYLTDNYDINTIDV